MGFLSLGRVRSATLGQLAGGALPIAVDFGVSSLKLIQLSAADTPSLVAAGCVETPEQFLSDPAKRLEFQFQALSKLVKTVPFRGKRAVCAIPAAQMFCKHMHFPKADNIDLGELVRSAVPTVLGCPPDALVYRHVVVEGASAVQTSNSSATGGGGSGPRQEVICMAAARDFVARLMGAIRDAKLEPVGLQPECVAALKAFEHVSSGPEERKLATLYLDLAAGSTKVWIAHGTSLVFAKTIALGGRDLDESVARTADCNLETARRKRLSARALWPQPTRAPVAGPGVAVLSGGVGTGGGAATAVVEPVRPPAGALAPQAEADGPDFDLRDALEALTDEIAMCLRYYESLFEGRRVDRAIFVGGESRHQALCQHVARRLRLPAHVADPMARMGRTGKEPCAGVDFSAAQPGWAIPFGLSLCPTDL